jgi:WD40 repeat protein
MPEPPVAPPPLAFSPDGTMLAVTPAPGAVRLLDVETAEELATLESGPILIAELCFSPDGSRLVAVGENRGMQMWDLRRARQRLAELSHDWERPLYRPAEPVLPLRVRLLP